MEIEIGFIGLGLIGGSLAKVWKSTLDSCKICVYSHLKTPEKAILKAKEDGVADKVVYDIDDLSDCDIIVLSAPVTANLEYLKKLKNIVKKSAIITDVGSVKGEIVRESEHLNISDTFIGGHPMAGSEKSTYLNADENLFENSYYILTPTDKTNIEKLDILKKLIEKAKAIPIIIDYKRHDEVVAAISHLPHIVATSLVGVVSTENDANNLISILAAGGFRDITRIASSSPTMWRDVSISNKDAIQKILGKYIEKLKEVCKKLDENEDDWLLTFFEDSKEYRDSIPLKKSNMSLTHEILLYIPDESGAIAILTSILASKNINIKNIGITHNREYYDGVLRIEFYDNKSKEEGLKAIKERNYKVFE